MENESRILIDVVDLEDNKVHQGSVCKVEKDLILEITNVFGVSKSYVVEYMEPQGEEQVVTTKEGKTFKLIIKESL